MSEGWRWWGGGPSEQRGWDRGPNEQRGWGRGPNEQRNKRRAASLVLIAGLALALLTTARHARHDTALIFRFDPDLSVGVRQLSVSWTPVGELEPAGGVTLNFPNGPGRQVRHVLSAAQGDYVIALQIGPSGLQERLPETLLQRRVNLAGTEVVIPLEVRGRE
jgi:hypothetical protein